MARPTFEELRAEADAFIGPPQPPKMQSKRPITQEEQREIQEWVDLRVWTLNLKK